MFSSFITVLQDGPYNYRALMGAMLLYFAQDPGTKPARRVWSSINVGTEIYVSRSGPGVTAEWTVSDFDVLVPEDVTSTSVSFY